MTHYKLGGDGDGIFFTQTTSFHITIWPKKMKETLQTVERLLPTNSLGIFPPLQMSEWSIHIFLAHACIIFFYGDGVLL